MPDDLNTTQKKPTPDSSPIMVSEPIETPSDAENASTDGFTPESQNIPVFVTPSEISEPGKKSGMTRNTEIQASSTSQPQTAQIPENELFTLEPEVKSEPETFSQPKIFLARELLTKARNMIQFRKRKKLDRVMTLFLKKSKITNDEVREFLHISDATAERYLNALEKENKIKQVGKTGKGVSYSKI